MPTSCDINFNNPSGIYYGGQCVSGTVRLVTRKSKTIRAIHLTVFGRAKVLWQETSATSSRKNTVTYTANDTYLNSRTYIIGCESGPSIEFSPGTYNYIFSCLLPPLLPTSFFGDCGSIKYYVKLTIERPYRFDNVFKTSFNVIYNLNLNYNPNLRIPSHVEDKLGFCLWCCKSGPLGMSLLIPITGYIPGQSITFTCFVENESSNNIKEIVAGVKQEVRFTSEYPYTKTNITKKTVIKKIIGKCLKFSKKEFCDSLEIPSVPQSTQNTCRIIEISYYLYAKAKTGFFSMDLLLQIPITIGGIPITTSASQEDSKITQSLLLENFQRGSSVGMPTVLVSLVHPQAPVYPRPPPPGFVIGIDLPPSHSNTINPPSYCDVMGVPRNQPEPIIPGSATQNSEGFLQPKL